MGTEGTGRRTGAGGAGGAGERDTTRGAAPTPATAAARVTPTPSGTPPAAGAAAPPVTRILVVDDHPVVRRGLAVAVLASAAYDVVGEAGSGEEAVRLFAALRPDLVLMDLVMPGMGGVAAIRAIRALDPEARILVLTNYPEGELVEAALQAGALGYHLKGVDLGALADAIGQAARGVASLAPEAAQALVAASRATRELGQGELTAREREVLALLVRGLSNAAIAAALVVTVATVKFHVRGIRTKLGTATRTETVAVALRRGLVPGP
jgi:NarL family two-component system response regulator LiaR